MLLVNHLGYNPESEKKVVFQTLLDEQPKEFLVKKDDSKAVYTGSFERGGKVDNWHTGSAYEGFFNELKQPGKYFIETTINGKLIKSGVFEIKDKQLAKSCIPLMLEGFKSIHPSEKYEIADSNIPFHGDRNQRKDVHGGWYDASGDYSKYLSHLCYTNYMCPQQTPLVVYNLLASARNLQQQNSNEFSTLADELIKEAAWGADFLVRMADDEGYFYTIVFDNWSKDTARRAICCYKTQSGERTEEYKAAFREGAGIAIAALARLGAEKVSGEYNYETYLEKAEKGFAHLLLHNAEYCDDGRENIIDDYCALMAATELYNATGKEEYLLHSRQRAQNISNRVSNDEKYEGWLRADEEGVRPYFHAAEAGYPLVALSRYLDVENDTTQRNSAINTIRQSVAFQLGISNEVHNPFGYPRQYVKAVNESTKKASFFIPHQNESGYWYQGENARIASLAAGMLMAQKYLLPEHQEFVTGFVQNQFNWILGLNPFNICMLEGIGHNNPQYLEPHNWNYKGGIANGITAGINDQNDIAFLPYPQNEDSAQRWRWPEQWIPHAGWFMLAVSLSR